MGGSDVGREDELMGLLDHKTAVVTGANSGIGLATAERFIAEGAERVFITGRRQPELSSAAARLGPRATPVPGDVGTPADLDRLYAEVAAAGKGLDVVVANAGSTRVARLGEISDDDLDTLLTTNVKGVVYTVQKALPLLNDCSSSCGSSERWLVCQWVAVWNPRMCPSACSRRMIPRPISLLPARGARVWTKNTALMSGCTGLTFRLSSTVAEGFQKLEALGPSSKVSRKRTGAWALSRVSVCVVISMGAAMQPANPNAMAAAQISLNAYFMFCLAPDPCGPVVDWQNPLALIHPCTRPREPGLDRVHRLW